MEHRYLGASGFKVPVLGLGTGTFGGRGPLFSAWGRTARDEAQLRANLGAVGWPLSSQHIAALDAASAATPPYPYYPYWNGQLAERNPAPVPVRAAAA